MVISLLFAWAPHFPSDQMLTIRGMQTICNCNHQGWAWLLHSYVLSTSGGWGLSAMVAFRRLAVQQGLTCSHTAGLWGPLLQGCLLTTWLHHACAWEELDRLFTMLTLLWWSVGMISLWTSSQVRPSCQIDTDLLLLLFASTIITINTVPMYFTSHWLCVIVLHHLLLSTM